MSALGGTIVGNGHIVISSGNLEWQYDPNWKADQVAGTIVGNGMITNGEIKDSAVLVENTNLLGNSPLATRYEVRLIENSEKMPLEEWIRKNHPHRNFSAASLNGFAGFITGQSMGSVATLNPIKTFSYFIENRCAPFQILQIVVVIPEIMGKEIKLENLLREFSCVKGGNP